MTTTDNGANANLNSVAGLLTEIINGAHGRYMWTWPTPEGIWRTNVAKCMSRVQKSSTITELLLHKAGPGLASNSTLRFSGWNKRCIFMRRFTCLRDFERVSSSRCSTELIGECFGCCAVAGGDCGCRKLEARRGELDIGRADVRTQCAAEGGPHLPDMDGGGARWRALAVAAAPLT